MKAESVSLKAVWVLGTLCGLAVGLFLLCRVTISFYRQETVTTNEKCADCKPTFPDVTVCNLIILASLADLELLT